MADALTEARANVHAAALAKEDLLHRAIEGEEIGDAELEAADLAHEQSERRLKLAEAAAVGAHQRAKLAQIEDLRKQAGVLESHWNDSLTQLVEAASAVDDKLADCQEALTAYFEAAKSCQTALTAGASWNSLWTNFGHHHNATLRDLPSDRQPRVHLPREGFSVPAAQIELYQNVGGTSIHAKRDVIHALGPRLRLQFGRPIAREKAA